MSQSFSLSLCCLYVLKFQAKTGLCSHHAFFPINVKLQSASFKATCVTVQPEPPLQTDCDLGLKCMIQPCMPIGSLTVHSPFWAMAWGTHCFYGFCTQHSDTFKLRGTDPDLQAQLGLRSVSSLWACLVFWTLGQSWLLPPGPPCSPRWELWNWPALAGELHGLLLPCHQPLLLLVLP